MARRLFYVDEIRAGRAWVRGETAEHLRRVLRAEPGQEYELSDGEAVWLGRIGRCRRDEVEFELLSPARQVRAPADVHLLAALVKFDRFEWMLEKATELGVARITPVASLRSEKGLEAAARKRRERWLKIVREAGQQSRRLRPPVLEEVLELKAALQSEADLRLWLEEEPGARPILNVLTTAPGRVAVLCGPEGGWEERERSAAAAAGWAAVSLGPMILRAETAALAAVAVVMAAKERER
ncbi:MAG: RsmE family RNA methyltransferase [Bryobacteraceae bacterium]